MERRASWGEVEKEILVWGIGGVTFALGLALRIWAQTYLHYRLKAKTALTTGGPYAIVRNPIYVANTVMMAGACMLAEMFWFVPIQVLYCAAVYSLVVRYEERHLAAKYGPSYLAYMRAVPRWFPTRRLPSVAADTRPYLTPSLLAEAHNLLLLLPFIVKELIVR